MKVGNDTAGELLQRLISNVAEMVGCQVDMVDWYAWPHTFSSTSGPRGGGAGQACTTFQVYAFIAEGRLGYLRSKYCHGVWQEWNGEYAQRWAGA